MRRTERVVSMLSLVSVALVTIIDNDRPEANV